MKKTLLIVLLASLLPCAGAAEEMLGHQMDECRGEACKKGDLVCFPSEQNLICYNQQSVKKLRDGTVRYWITVVAKKGTTLEKGGKTRSILEAHRVRCDEETQIVETASRYSDYFGKGKTLFSFSPPYPEYTPLPPGSFGEAFGKWACEKVNK